jgi:acyl-homoserine lactone acylase PvdQ
LWHDVSTTNNNATTMSQNNPYLVALRNRGITIEQMADYLASQGVGSPQQWRQALATGNKAVFSKADAANAKQFLSQNQDIAREIGNILQAS